MCSGKFKRIGGENFNLRAAAEKSPLKRAPNTKIWSRPEITLTCTESEFSVKHIFLILIIKLLLKFNFLITHLIFNLTMNFFNFKLEQARAPVFKYSIFWQLKFLVYDSTV